MISNEDYKDIKDSSHNGLTLLYRYYTAIYGMRISAGAFMIKFQEWCIHYQRVDLNVAVEWIIDYLDCKHEYIGFIENWR